MTHSITIHGKTYRSRTAAAAAYGISYDTFQHRLYKGWSPEDAVMTVPYFGRQIALLAKRGRTVAQIARVLRTQASTVKAMAERCGIEVA
jgi:DNA-binding NarL/FixJ family response regulator